MAEFASQGLQGQILHTRQTATAQDQYNYASLKDWRVVLSLAPQANYLYRAPNPGILSPLAATDGVVFPYTPQVQVQYTANYDQTDITHSNYKIYQYKNSNVDSVSITGDFTAQDTFEANYLLAVIHFFRSVTKMFYGQDENPNRGTPPPLCYLYGLGTFQFNNHPLVITSFNYTLPNDCDYIRASVDPAAQENTPLTSFTASNTRLNNSYIQPGGLPPPPEWAASRGQNYQGVQQPTYVPTKMQIQIQAIPMMSRLDLAKNFSLRDFATGQLLLGTERGEQGGGIW